jgi:D-threo-aldose 1-dehydrogenase
MSASTVTQVGLGTAALAGLFEETDAATARATVDRAWELGIRYFDTAPSYGSGLAEQRLGEALRGRPRADFVVSTKVGRLLRPGAPEPMFKGAPPLGPVVDFTPDGVRRAMAESLERLRLDRVNIVFIHDPDDYIEHGIAVVPVLRDMGAEVGVGTTSVQTALAFARDSEIDRVMIAGRYTPLDPSAGEVLLELCQRRGISVTAAGVFNSGLLSGDSTFDYQLPPVALIERTRQLAAMCERYAVPLEALALQFPLRNPAVSRIVIGPRTPAELEEDIGLLAHPIPDDLWLDPLTPSTVNGLPNRPTGGLA